MQHKCVRCGGIIHLEPDVDWETMETSDFAAVKCFTCARILAYVNADGHTDWVGREVAA